MPNGWSVSCTYKSYLETPGFLDSFIQFKSQLLQISPKDSVTEILFNFHEKMRKPVTYFPILSLVLSNHQENEKQFKVKPFNEDGDANMQQSRSKAITLLSSQGSEW